jgi:hypothetical protein
MPKIAYEEKNFAPKTLAVIEQANAIIALYAAQGYDLTLRQLYYQFVSRDLIANKQTEYKRLGSIVSDGRRAGLIDWNAITDRTRNLRGLSHWQNPSDIMGGAAASYRIDKWATQDYRPEIWIEKDALAGVFERVGHIVDVPYFSCRGYTSDSEMWAAAMRLASYRRKGKIPLILHFGDHDPSGIDMTRDIEDRLALFGRGRIEVRRLALNMDQIDQYNPPPNPAKETDSRFAGYSQLHGDESWELDALEPTVLAALVRKEIDDILDTGAWATALDQETEEKALLQVTADHWQEVSGYVGENYEDSVVTEIERITTERRTEEEDATDAED